MERPYVPFYKPYGMTDEEYEYEVRIAEQRLAEWEAEQAALQQADVIKSVCVCKGETGGYKYGENDKTKCSTCGKEKQTVL